MELFNKGEYFEAHEELEGAWLETSSPERDLYQGILQIGLAYYQISRGNYGGALKMFKRGQIKLKNLGESMMGINISQLIEDAHIVETNLRDLGGGAHRTTEQGFNETSAIYRLVNGSSQVLFLILNIKRINYI